MIVAISPNLALDRIVAVDGFQAGRQCRARFAFYQPGGSGAHAASLVRAFGGPAKVIGLLGGYNGQKWREAADAQGLPYEVVPLSGETRLSYCIVDAAQGNVVESVEEGPQAGPEHLEQLLALVEKALPGCKLLVLSGSLPPDLPLNTYARLVELANRSGTPTWIDGYGEPLNLALRKGPALVKPNLAEFHRWIGRITAGLEDRAAESRRLSLELQLCIALSMEKEGLLLTTPQEQWRLLPPTDAFHLPDGPGLNVIGCGDALVGAMAYEFVRSGQLVTAVALGLAAAHYNLGTYGAPQIEPAAVRQLAQKVKVEKL